jgi:translation initiation factor 3 subunit G
LAIQLHLFSLELPKNEEFVDENGIRTTIEYTFNEEGKKVKVWAYIMRSNKFPSLTIAMRTQITRRIKRTLQKSVVDHAVAERQKWAKFGQEKGSKPGPDRATTTVGENVALKLSVGNKVTQFFLNCFS